MSEALNFKNTEEGLIKAGEIYGKEVEVALREHLSMIGKDFYRWLARLYTPRKCTCNNFDSEGNRVCLLPRDENGKCKCTGGGFYYCNSARDTEWYEIDIESTAQAIFFIENTGFINHLDKDIGRAFPTQMQKDVVAFAKSLQDSEDGYFYHPQWGKNVIASRIGRDLGWATSLIRDFGDQPFYDTKNGHKGSLGAPKVAAPSSESTEAPKSTWVAHLASLDAFREYIGAFDLKTRSYPSGNAINAQVGQIRAREAQAILDGELIDSDGDGVADDGFLSALRNLFDAAQNPENGLWEDEVHYNSVNGLMKISTSYNSFGFRLNYAERAFDSAIEMILCDSETPDCKEKYATGSVDIFNPWVSLSTILANVRRFDGDEAADKLQSKLKLKAADMIRATSKKVAKFKKADGSFGYTWCYPPSKSQGAPVCPPGIVEGDINGGCIATNGVWRTMTVTLLGERIPLFAKEDYEELISIIKEVGSYK